MSLTLASLSVHCQFESLVAHTSETIWSVHTLSILAHICDEFTLVNGFVDVTDTQSLLLGCSKVGTCSALISPGGAPFRTTTFLLRDFLHLLSGTALTDSINSVGKTETHALV